MYNMVHLTRPEGAVGGHHTAPGDQLHVEASTFVSDTDWRINLMSMFWWKPEHEKLNTHKEFVEFLSWNVKC